MWEEGASELPSLHHPPRSPPAQASWRGAGATATTTRSASSPMTGELRRTGGRASSRGGRASGRGWVGERCSALGATMLRPLPSPPLTGVSRRFLWPYTSVFVWANLLSMSIRRPVPAPHRGVEGRVAYMRPVSYPAGPGLLRAGSSRGRVASPNRVIAGLWIFASNVRPRVLCFDSLW